MPPRANRVKSGKNRVKSGKGGFEEVGWGPFLPKTLINHVPNCILATLNLLEESGKSGKIGYEEVGWGPFLPKTLIKHAPD